MYFNKAAAPCAALAAVAAGLLCRGAVALGVPRLPRAHGARPGAGAGARWGLDEQQPPDENEAVAKAREQVSPEIVPNVNDWLWYHGDYQYDKANSLEDLTAHTDQVGPTPEQAAKAKAKEDAEMAVLGPRVEAEAAEMNDYFKNNFERDEGNDLEDFTFSSSYYEGSGEEQPA